MKNSLLLALILMLTMLFPAFATGSGSETITMKLPESVLVDSIQKSLPIQLSHNSETLGGVISITRIDKLDLQDQGLSALVGLTGTDVKINTVIAGHQIALNVGTVQLDFNITASLRYDEPSQTLFINPQISESSPENDPKGKEIGALLVSLFNGREIPVVIDRLQPIITNTGSRQLVINMHVKDIVVQPDALVLHLLPDITATDRPKK